MADSTKIPTRKGINEDLWDFPCQYDLKVMGAARHPLDEIVAEIVERFIEDFDRTQHIKSKASRNGKFVSITASFTLTHKDQVEGIYEALSLCKEISLTL